MSGDKLYILGSKSDVIVPEEIARTKQIPFRSFLSIEKLCDALSDAKCVLAYTPYRLHTLEGNCTSKFYSWKDICARLAHLDFNGKLMFLEHNQITPENENNIYIFPQELEIPNLMELVEQTYAR